MAVGIAGMGGASAASITWSTSPAVSATEVNTSGTGQWAYAFSSALAGTATVNGVTFTYLNTGGAGGPMPDSNALTPGFERQGNTSYGEASDEFYLGPNAELNQLLDGLTWGGDRPVSAERADAGSYVHVPIVFQR